MPKHTVTKQWNETSLPFMKSDQAVYSTRVDKVKHVKQVSLLQARGNESIIKMEVKPKVGKAHAPYLGSRGTVVPKSVSDQLWELEGIRQIRQIPPGVQRLVYRLWFSQEIITQRNYFKKVKRTDVEKTNLNRDIDSVSRQMKMASGLAYSNFPSVVTSEKLALLFIKLELPSGIELTQAKNLLLQKKNDEAFVNMLYSEGVGRPFHKPKKQHSKGIGPQQPPKKVSTDSVSFAKSFRSGRGRTFHTIQLNGSHGEATNSDDVSSDIVTQTSVSQSGDEGVCIEISGVEVHGVVHHTWYDGQMFEIQQGGLALELFPICQECEDTHSYDQFATLRDDSGSLPCAFCDEVYRVSVLVKRLPIENGCVQFCNHYFLSDDEYDDMTAPGLLYCVREDGTWVEVNRGIRVSQLNGPNGEWTASDDVDSQQGKKKDAPLAKKKPPVSTGKPPVECKFHKVGQCKHGNTCKFKHVDNIQVVTTQVDAKKEPKKVKYVVLQQNFDYGYDGYDICRKVYRNQVHTMVTSAGRIIPHVIEGELIHNVVGSGHGWVEVEDGKGGDHIASGAMCLRECYAESIRVDTKREVFLPLESCLKKLMCGANKELGYVRTAALAITNKQFGELDITIANNTIAAYLLSQAVNVERLSHSLDQLLASETNLYTSLGETIQHTGFWREYGTDANIKMDWPVREDIYILPVSRGIYRFAAVNQGCSYVRFETPGLEVQKTYLTCMLRFVGNTTSKFVEYRINGFNCMSAMKRLIGCNDHNDMYMAFQYSNAKLLYVEAADQLKFWKLVRVKTEFDDYDQQWIVVGNKIHSHRCNISEASLMKHYTTLVDMCVSRQSQGDVLFELPEVHVKVRANLNFIFDQMVNRVKPGVLQFCVDEFVTHTNWAYHKIVEQYYLHLDPMWSRQFAAKEIVHIKRKLRSRWFDGIEVHANSDCLVEELTGHLKREFAKPGKAARFFVSYGKGALYAPELPEILKLCIHGTYYLEGNKISMSIIVCSKLRTNELNDIFIDVLHNIDTRDHLYFVIFSDDSCLLGNYKNHRVMANIDISSCDSSNRFPIFATVYSLLYQIEPERAYGLVEQCTKNIKIVNPSNEAENIRLFMDSCFEGSGTCLTTVLNHVASTAIGTAIFTILDSFDLVVKEAVPLAAALVGHKVTYEEVDCVEKIQFLKRSPMMCVNTSTGERSYRMCLNMGTVFRGLGTVEGDMTALQLGITNREFAELTQQEKMSDFLSVVVEGLKTEPSNVLLDSLRQRFCTYDRVGGRVKTAQHQQLLDKHYFNVDKGAVDASPWQVEAGGLQSRYDLSDDQLDFLISQISNCRIGAVYTSPAIASIFAADYGLMD